MRFDFLSCLGNITNCEINLDTLKVPESKVDTEIPTVVEPPKPEIKPDPVDTFQSKLNNSNIFTQEPPIDWFTWEVSDISIEAFKTDYTYSAKLIENDAALKLAFADPEKNFTDFFISDKFQDYENGDGKWSYAEMKDFEKKLTELDAKGQLTTEQKKGLESLRKECSQIEAQASRFAESGLNVEPDNIIDLRLKNGGEKFYQDLTKLSNTVKEQEAKNLAAEATVTSSFSRDFFAQENTAETRINKLADKLITNDYSSKEAKQKDLDEFMRLYTELGKAEKLQLKENGIFDRIMNKAEIQTVIKNSINESQKNFLDRYKELKKLERSGNISTAENEILQKMEEQKDTILALQKRIKDNPEEAYKYYQELMIAYAEAGDYRKAADMANGKVTATDTAHIQERMAQTETEKKAAKVYKNVLVSDPILRERNKVDSQELDSCIKLLGSLDKFQQEYSLSNNVTASIKNEMRELYTNDKSTYIQYYDNSRSNYYSSSNEGTQSRPGTAEFYSLSKTEQYLTLGRLNTEIAQNNAVEELTLWGVPKNIAIAIVTNNIASLDAKTKEMPSEVASKYRSLAGLNATNPNPNYVNPFLGLSIS